MHPDTPLPVLAPTLEQAVVTFLPQASGTHALRRTGMLDFGVALPATLELPWAWTPQGCTGVLSPAG